LEDQLGVTYKTAWLLTQKLRRSMVDPNREPLEGVVEVDQAEIPFRRGNAFFEPGNDGIILVIGAVEVIDRRSNQAKPRRKRAKYLDTRSGRLRLAVIADNSAASIAAFVRANVKPGTTLLTDGHASYLRLKRLPARSPRCRRHGRSRRFTVDPSGFRGSEGEAYDVDAARRRLCAAAFRPARPRRSGPALAGSCLLAVSPLVAGVTWPVAAACLTVVASALAATRSTAAVSALTAMMTCLTFTTSSLTDRAPRPAA
jgi:hypothetical protein